MPPDSLSFTIRPTAPTDLPAIDTLLKASYPTLLKRDYPPSVLVTALPLISRAQPGLLGSGTYFLAETPAGEALAAGGWTARAPQGGAGARHIGHIRQVVTHPRALRQGMATAILQHAMCQALSAGVELLVCQSTRTAVPFYATLGFQIRGDVLITLRPGITFPAVEMQRGL